MSQFRRLELRMMSAKRAGADSKRDLDDDDRPEQKGTGIREGKPLPPLFPPHPKIPTIRKSTDALNRALEVTYYIRYSLRDSAYFVAPEKKRNYIERYQDRYDVRPPKKYLYKQIDASIQLLPEELVTGKAKRMWIAQRRGTEKLDGDESESESDEESGEEKSKAEDDEDGLDLEDDAEDEDEYEYETFSDDDAGDEDDGPDEATY